MSVVSRNVKSAFCSSPNLLRFELPHFCRTEANACIASRRGRAPKQTQQLDSLPLLSRQWACLASSLPRVSSTRNSGDLELCGDELLFRSEIRKLLCQHRVPIAVVFKTNMPAPPRYSLSRHASRQDGVICSAHLPLCTDRRAPARLPLVVS